MEIKKTWEELWIETSSEGAREGQYPEKQSLFFAYRSTVTCEN